MARLLLILALALAAPAGATELPAGGAAAAPWALEADDECAAASGPQCALNALQRRGKQLAAQGLGAEAPAAEERAADFVPPGKHQAASLPAPATGTHASSCDEDTSGTCRIMSCGASRGPTTCSQGGCKCRRGWCAQHGRCFATPEACVSDTGGTCAALGCASSRGETECVSGKCMCKPGHCAMDGKCFAVTATGGTCNILGCASSRGPTRCVRGKCLCQDGFVADAGVCKRRSR